MHEHEAFLKLVPCFGATLVLREYCMTRQQTSPAYAVLDITLLRCDAFDELDSGPDATGILPSASRPAEPLAKDRTGGNRAALAFVQRTRKD